MEQHAKPDTTIYSSDSTTRLLQQYAEWSGRLAAILDSCVGDLIEAEGNISHIMYYRKILANYTETFPESGSYLIHKEYRG